MNVEKEKNVQHVCSWHRQAMKVEIVQVASVFFWHHL